MSLLSKVKKNEVKANLEDFSILVRGAEKSGKAQPVDSKILTPNGFVRMGDIKVGDIVIGEDGKGYNVTGVFPQGIIPSYKIVFSDGSSTECNDEHIWNVCATTWKRTHKGKYRNMTLKEIMNIGVHSGVDKRNGKLVSKWSIPVMDGVMDFEEKEHFITPYMLGLFLGDGYLNGNSLQFSTSEVEIINRIKNDLKEGYDICKNGGENYTWYIKKPTTSTRNEYMQEFDRLNLRGCLSGTKFIPQEYLIDSYENRLKLLQGIFDTDGSVLPTKQSITTISEKMKDDIVWLCRSLGMIANVTEDSRNEKYSTGHCYTISIHAKDQSMLFTSSKHIDRYKENVRKTRFTPKRFIKSVEYVGDKEMQCIMIDNPSHLYITDDFIVTHNTTFYSKLVIAAYGTPDAGLLIPFETGYRALAGVNIFPHTISPTMHIDGEEFRGWQIFTDLVDELVETAGKNGIKIICLDTVDRFVDVAIEETLRQSRIQTKKPCKSINDAFGGFSRGKSFCLDLMKEQIGRLRNAGYGIVSNGHVKYKTIKDKIMQEEYQIVGSNLTEDYDKAIANDADFILMISEEKSIKNDIVVGSERYLRLRSDGFYNCGSRFQDVPERIELSADKFMEVFRNAVKSASGVKSDSELDKIAKEQHEEKVAEVEKFKEEATDVQEKLIEKIKAHVGELDAKEKGAFVKEVTDRKINLKDPKSNSIEALRGLAELYNIV